MMQYQRLADR